MDAQEQLFKELSETSGIGGHEGAIATIMKRELSSVADISSDKLGSIIAEQKGSDASGPRIMLAAHMDEIGFMVSRITSKGFIRFLPIGGWWGHTVLGQRVVIETRKGAVLGVVGSKPPHIIKADERKKVVEIEDMYIDVGATEKFDIEKRLGIRPGDPIIPDSSFAIMNNKKMYMGKAWDNRLGCAIVIEVMKRLNEIEHPNTVYGVGTVQEEVGLRGAGTAAYTVNPDVGFSLDVNIAQDTPGCATASEKVGAGASICVYDSSMVPNSKLRDLVVDTAEKHKHAYHYSSIARGGTDAGRIHVSRSGVPSLFVGVATRYIHGHNSIFHRDDFEHTVRLMVDVITMLDKKMVTQLARW